MANEKHIETIRTVAYIAWKAAANAFRLYPDGKHTFSEYWATAKIQFTEELELLQSEHDERMNSYEMANKIINDDLKETIRQLTQEVERLKGKAESHLDEIKQKFSYCECDDPEMDSIGFGSPFCLRCNKLL